MSRRPEARQADRVFVTKEGKALPSREARKKVQEYMQYIGLNKFWKPHACRAAGASLMILAGVPVVTVCRHGGWTTFEAFWSAYAHTFAPENVSKRISEYVQRSSTSVEAAAIHVSELSSAEQEVDELPPALRPPSNSSTRDARYLIENTKDDDIDSDIL